MRAFTVYHDVNPIFGIESLRATAGPAKYVVVARGNIDVATDEEACDYAFVMTNSVDEAWPIKAARSGLHDIREARSTSIGDLVRIEDANGSRFYRCAEVGWKKHDGAVPLASSGDA